jgi:hypothetical protein
MPKCLDCNNTRTFTFWEDTYNEATYDSEGDLEDVTYKDFANVRDGACYECKSTNIEGQV